jgi:hypothetical protein
VGSPSRLKSNVWFVISFGGREGAGEGDGDGVGVAVGVGSVVGDATVGIAVGVTLGPIVGEAEGVGVGSLPFEPKHPAAATATANAIMSVLRRMRAKKRGPV